MIQILALIFALILLVKVVAFLIFPEQFLDFTERTYRIIDEYGLIIQGILVVLTIAIGVALSMLVGFYTMVVAGWFWGCVYSLFLVPVMIESIKKDNLKDTLFDPAIKNQILAACVFMVGFCILTIALAL